MSRRKFGGATTAARLVSSNNKAWRPSFILSLFAILWLLASTRTVAADLSRGTIQIWERYVNAADDRNQMHLVSGRPFLSLDATQGQAARLRDGEIAASPAGSSFPVKVPSGLIHDWTGAVFIPGVTINDVLRVVRNYDEYKDIYRPNVVASKPTGTGEGQDRFSLVLMNKSRFARTAIDADYRSSYTRVDDQRWFSISETTRVREIAQFGTPSQQTLPEGQGTGLIWRIHSIARFEERDGGVYVEVEVLALSRDIPSALRWLVEPIVHRISRSSLTTSLEQTKNATLFGLEAVNRSSSCSRGSEGTCKYAGALADSFR